MANDEHLRIIHQGMEAWNRWRETDSYCFEKRPDLSRADLSGLGLNGFELHHANLCGANLAGAELGGSSLGSAELREANLQNAILIRAELVMADFSRADLRNAIMTWADLQDAKFNEATLRGADLRLANLCGAQLDQADFNNCTIGRTLFVGVDLSCVHGLSGVHHDSPSWIDIDTICLSQGRIPDSFLRGAGIPEAFISNVKALVAAMDPIQFYSCFISYSSKDQEFATRLHDDLQGKGVRCWFAPEDLKIGDKLRPCFDDAIRIHDKLMVILSEHSVKSQWVEREVEAAFEKEQQQQTTVLFPIRLDDAVMETKQAWAADIRRTRQIGDFRDWKTHDSYKTAFDRLLRDLEAEDRVQSAAEK